MAQPIALFISTWLSTCLALTCQFHSATSPSQASVSLGSTKRVCFTGAACIWAIALFAATIADSSTPKSGGGSSPAPGRDGLRIGRR
ncbi:MAG: hypothetical protein HC771_01470 [Synechococcales cyanobacterium CRU_2_2]|nr:hypothetical protein [Synechococcales cyanobacterium CRU_2_2]